jgi:RluA family pseudouridine synthase
MITYLDVRAPDIPARFPSPFAVEPSPLARLAADALRALLEAGVPGVDMATLQAPGGGKMFGVLVVADGAGRVGYLKAFSGMLDGRWLIDGFAPPLFDPAHRDTFWPAAEAELASLLARHDALTAALAPLEADLALLAAAHASARAALRATHATRKSARAARRAALVPDTLASPRSPSQSPVPATHASPRGPRETAVPDTLASSRSSSERAVPDTRATSRCSSESAVPDTLASSRGSSESAVPDTLASSRGSSESAVPDTLASSRGSWERAVPDTLASSRGSWERAVPDTLASSRSSSESAVPDTDAILHGLAQESRADTAELRRLDAAHRAEHEVLAARIAALTAARDELEAHRAERSRFFWDRILDGYVVPDARGAHAPLSSLFAPHVPPGGAGDCAAPKLLAAAYRAGLRPLALAELWWGAPPATGGRHAGHFYPACRGKCGPILGHMLGGLDAAPAPLFGAAAIPDDAPRVVHADPWLVIVDKPAGLLSVPGRHAALKDSVLVRLRRRYPDATGPLVVHRLDLDTSGLLVIALDDDTHAAMQRLFARREVTKRYIAILAGDVAADRGTIELPLRVDLDDRPRQIVDPVHGKPAVTDFEVLARTPGRTRVALYPRTGRTHQLRVHCAHPQGLAAPILGDRLYGSTAADRLHLHAEHLAFAHPRTGEPIGVDLLAPF